MLLYADLSPKDNNLMHETFFRIAVSVPEKKIKGGVELVSLPQ